MSARDGAEGASETRGADASPEVEGETGRRPGASAPSPAHGSTPRAPSDPLRGLAALTPARIALGRSGGALPTREVLRFGLDHARARDAVHSALDTARIGAEIADLGLSTLEVASTAESRAVYLRRPDLGRRLTGDSAALLRAHAAEVDAEGPAGCDLALVVADGLSPTAVHAQAAALIAALLPTIRQEGWRLAPVVLATQARVALGDEIGALLGAGTVAVLVGERPGLSSIDSLGIYLTYAPRPGRTDAERNCISNVRQGGLSAREAAHKLVWLVREARRRQLSGVALKDASGKLALTAGPEVPKIG